MKKVLIIFYSVLLIMPSAICLAKDADAQDKRHQRITTRFIEILNEQWGISKDKFSGESLFLKNFGADDTDVMELVMALEEDFDVEIPYEKWDRVTTIHSAVDLIIVQMDISPYELWKQRNKK